MLYTKELLFKEFKDRTKKEQSKKKETYTHRIAYLSALKEVKSKVMIFACRQGEVEEMTTAILDRKFFKRYKFKGSYV